MPVKQYNLFAVLCFLTNPRDCIHTHTQQLLAEALIAFNRLKDWDYCPLTLTFAGVKSNVSGSVSHTWTTCC